MPASERGGDSSIVVIYSEETRSEDADSETSQLPVKRGLTNELSGEETTAPSGRTIEGGQITTMMKMLTNASTVVLIGTDSGAPV